MINKLKLNVVCVIVLFNFAGSASACYDGRDAVKSTTGYDIPESTAVDNCYYKGDVIIAQHDRIEASNNVSDLSESKIKQSANEQKILNKSERLALEKKAVPVIKSMSQGAIKNHSKNSEVDSENYDWVPIEWYSLH